MKIQIKELNKSESLVESSKILWKLFAKKNKALFLLEFVVGLGFITWGLLDNEYTFKGLNLIFSFGIACIFLSLIYYYHLYRNKKLYFRKVSWYLQKYKNSQSECIIEISDDFVRYEDFEKKNELKWSVFTSYKIISDFLFLITDDLLLAPITINKKLITNDEFNAIIEFVKKKLPEKK